MELPVLEAIVGHVDRETTKIYTHLHAEDLVEAVQAIKEKSLTVRNKSVTRSEASKSETKKVRKAKEKRPKSYDSGCLTGANVLIGLFEKCGCTNAF